MLVAIVVTALQILKLLCTYITVVRANLFRKFSYALNIPKRLWDANNMLTHLS